MSDDSQPLYSERHKVSFLRYVFSWLRSLFFRPRFSKKALEESTIRMDSDKKTRLG